MDEEKISEAIAHKIRALFAKSENWCYRSRGNGSGDKGS